MATHTITGRGCYEKTLTASVVDTVNFDTDWNEVEVVSNGLAPLFVTVDGSSPTVNGEDSYILPAGTVSSRTIVVPGSGTTTVKVISSAPTTYSVAGV